MGNEIELTIDMKDNTEAVKKNMDAAVKKALYAAGVLLQQGATESISGKYNPENLAVKTGRLRASITFSISETEKSVTYGTNVEYAADVHNGMWTSEKGGKNKKYKVRPFLREGLEQKKDEIKSKIDKISRGEL